MKHPDILDAESTLWLSERFTNLTTRLDLLEPSEWAEKQRYLPSSVTPMPGPYDFAVAPFLIEMVDNMSIYSPVREMDVLKGVQTCFTVGVIENTIGYIIDHVKTAPSMFLTADAELAKIRIEKYIIPMLQHSDMEHLIRSSDETNPRKTGKTDKSIEWEGGGYMVPFGAKNADKLRSISVEYLFMDEIDAYPPRVGRDGDPLKLAFDRTASFEHTRKVVRGSTPLIMQDSKAWREYLKGDQREYRVPCRHCGEPQKLIWHGLREDGSKYGIDWELDEDRTLIPGSVCYICKHCDGRMVNDDKLWMYRERGRYAEWVPTAKPISPFRRSYHISALYSPVGMQTWEAQVLKFLDAYDTIQKRVIDMDAYQQFRNNVEGLPFEIRGDQLRFERVVENRSPHYKSGTIPNKLAKEQTGSKVLFLVASVDIHKAHIDVLVQGVTARGIQYSIDWFKIEGDDCSNINDPAWSKLEAFVDDKIYTSDDGFNYKPTLTLVDAGWASETVYSFVNKYASGVVAIKGKAPPARGHYHTISQFNSKTGLIAYNIIVDDYKSKLASKLKQSWDGRYHQRDWHMNYPADYGDDFFKELTKEQKVAKFEDKTGRFVRYEWHRPGNADNHAWDLSVYCVAGIDMIVKDVCMDVYGMDHPNFTQFWEYAASGVFTLEGSFDDVQNK